MIEWSERNKWIEWNELNWMKYNERIEMKYNERNEWSEWINE
jgi:hypothetical protein